MATSAFPLIGIAALALTACDLSQKRPEMIEASRLLGGGATPAAAAPMGSTPSLPAGAIPRAPAAVGGNAAGADSAGERSIRLYGPGVSRKRQTRV